MKLIIAEKKIAGERIAKILSSGKAKKEYKHGIPIWKYNDWILVPLSGHILEHDFPRQYRNWYSIKVKDLLKIKPVEYPKHPRIVKVLKELGKKAKEIIIATDFDREGELIGWEAVKIIKSVNPNIIVKRARFSAITEEEIKKAFQNLTNLDKNLAMSALARRIIDLYWGVLLTRIFSLLGKRMKKRKIYSVGRVQTPTLNLVVKREEEIRSFKPKEYYRVFLDLGKIKIELDRRIERKEDLEIFKKIKEVELFQIMEEEEKIPQPPPYNTTSFLKDCSTILGINVKRAMQIAEKLYMEGYISYPRTANTVYPKDMKFKKILFKLAKMKNELGKMAVELLARKLVISRGKTRDTDHPPIHPVNPAFKISSEEFMVYELVVRRFYATISGPGILKKVILKFKDEFGNTYTYSGRKVIDPGWLRYFSYTKVQESEIIKMERGRYKVLKVIKKKEKTKPPSRYSEGTLVKEMEKLNLGTKATRHEIITKIFSREYVKGRRSIKPTEYAEKIISVLRKFVPEITLPDMTAKLEEEMDKIAKGEKNIREVIDESLKILEEIIEKIERNKNEISRSLTKGS